MAEEDREEETSWLRRQFNSLVGLEDGEPLIGLAGNLMPDFDDFNLREASWTNWIGAAVGAIAGMLGGGIIGRFLGNRFPIFQSALSGLGNTTGGLAGMLAGAAIGWTQGPNILGETEEVTPTPERGPGSEPESRPVSISGPLPNLSDAFISSVDAEYLNHLREEASKMNEMDADQIVTLATEFGIEAERTVTPREAELSIIKAQVAALASLPDNQLIIQIGNQAPEEPNPDEPGPDALTAEIS